MAVMTRSSVASILLVVCGGITRAGAGELAGTAAVGNKASIEMIETYYSEVNYESTAKGEKWARTGLYWWDRAKVRMTEQTGPGRITDVRRDGGKTTVLTTETGRQRQKREAGMLVGDRSRRAVETDAWELSLFSLPVGLYRKPSYPVYSLFELVDKGQVVKEEWVEEGKRRLAHLVVDVDKSGRTYELWVDQNRNWLVARCAHVIRGPEGEVRWRIEHEVKEWAEVKPSVFVPTLVTDVRRYGGKVVSESVMNIRNIKVNETLPPIPKMPLPSSGVLVYDELDGTYYQADSSGKRIGEARRVGASYSPPLPSRSEKGLVGLPAGWWALGAGALTIGVGAFVGWRKRIKSRQAR